MEEIRRVFTDKDEVFVEIDQDKQHVFELQYRRQSGFSNIFGGSFAYIITRSKLLVGKMKGGTKLVFPDKLCLKVKMI